MAFQTIPGAIVIGSQTAGADGNVSKFYLPGGIHTCFSGVGIYYPDGTETQRVVSFRILLSNQPFKESGKGETKCWKGLCDFFRKEANVAITNAELNNAPFCYLYGS